MDEKIREAIRQGVADGFKTWRDEQDSGLPVQRIMDAIEAKLSPKYPPAEAICEVWANVGDGNHYYRYGRQVLGWDHYRRIVTAEEALKALRAAYFGATYPDGDRDNERAWAISVIQRLIDDAERG